MSSIPFAVDLESVEHECGGTFRLTSEMREVRIAGKPFRVDHELFHCSGCGEERQTLTQMGAVQRAAAQQARETQRLLRPDEIRAIRENRLRVSQALLEQGLGLGAKTVVRWETGKVLQPKATDNLLRLLDRDPSLFLFLAENHGVSLSREVIEQLASSNAGLSLPRKLADDLRKIAEDQDVGLETYVVWVLTERVSAEKQLPADEWSETLRSVVGNFGEKKIWNTGEFKLEIHNRRHNDPPGWADAVSADSRKNYVKLA